MKKITAFFLALFPLIVIVLLFVSGMLVKDYTHVFVTSVEFTEDSWVCKYENPDPYPSGKHQFVANVLPFNATEPTVYYMSTNEDVATIDDNGLLTIKDFGETDVIAISKENKNITATCPVKITDDKIHRIEITNAPKNNCYVGYHESLQLKANPIPFDGLNDAIDPTVYFDQLTSRELDVTTDGQLIGHEVSTEASQPIDVEYRVKEQQGQPEVEGSVKVNVGPGVTAIEFENPSDEYILDDQKDLFKDMLIFPEDSSEGRIKPTDFIYTSSDTDVATVDGNGKVQFLKPGQSEFTVTYINNPELKISKKISSSCKNAVDVAFNRYSFTDAYENYETDPYIKDITWSVFPTDEQLLSKVEITSSNEQVVSYEENNGLKVNGIGYATLYAKVKVGDETTKIDNCVVHITKELDEDQIFNEETVPLADSYIYPLRNNLKFEALPSKNIDVKWSVNPDSKQYINPDALEHGLLCFNYTIDSVTPGHLITVYATFNDIDGDEITKSFNVAWYGNIEAETITVEDGRNVLLTAGKKYRFVDKNGINLGPNLPLIQHDFSYNVTDNTLIPYWGFNCGEMYLYYDESWIIADMTINVVVQQDPVCVIADENYPLYTTTKTDINLVPTPTSGLDVGQIGVYPDTATKPDGSPWIPTFDFQFEDPETGTVTQVDSSYIIHFNKAGYINIAATINQQTENFILKSTYNKIGKFTLTKDGEKIQSGDEISLSPDMTSPVTLSLDQVQLSEKITSFEEYFKDEDIKCLSNDCICKVNRLTEAPWITFDIQINPNGHHYGSDVIMINAGDFTFYLNVKIEEPTIDKFNLYYHGKKLKTGEEANIAYTPNLVLNIEKLPLISEDTVTATYDGQGIETTGGKITLENISPTKHTIELTSTRNGYSQIFTIDVKSPSDLTDFTIKEAESNNGSGAVNTLYFPCAATQCGLTIEIADALVPDDFFEQNFDCAWVDEKPSPEVISPIANNHIIVSKIPRPTSQEPGYNRNIKVWLKKTGGTPIEKTYNLYRDKISRIVLPNHDNAKISDQKGLQKVRVFGNETMFNKDEGILDYYCLPIELYDYHRNLITDPAEKAKYYNELHVDMFSYHHTYARPEYDIEHDCIKIHFSKDDLYTPEEIYNNKFESGYKNVKIKIETASRLSNAQYEFIPVSGVNAYCQEAFMERKGAVLQTNFGLPEGTKDNVPVTRTDTLWHLGTIYGNGYTTNFEAFYLHNAIFMDGLINTSMQGLTDAQFKTHTECDFEFSKMGDGDWTPRYAAYNVFSNFTNGTAVFENVIAYIKDCLFFNNFNTSMSVSGPDATGYIQDCVFFNSSSTALTALVGGKAFLKGFIDVYNFRNRDALQNILGHDLSFLWDALAPLVRQQGGVQIGADGREYLNSFMLTYKGQAFFWNPEHQAYESSDRGFPGNCPHVRMFLKLPILEDASLWGTISPTVDPTSYSYYDEFDKEGNLRWDFLNNQLDKITRPINRLATIFGY